MVRIEKATVEDAEGLTAAQTRTFLDDNVRKPPGCSMGGPPGYDSVAWNARWIEQTHYCKILYRDQIVGGLIVFEMGERHHEPGRIYVDPGYQNRGIGQQAMRLLFRAFPHVDKWTLGTPSWATRNQHFYEKLGFVKVGEVELDPNLPLVANTILGLYWATEASRGCPVQVSVL